MIVRRREERASGAVLAWKDKIPAELKGVVMQYISSAGVINSGCEREQIFAGT